MLFRTIFNVNGTNSKAGGGSFLSLKGGYMESKMQAFGTVYVNNWTRERMYLHYGSTNINNYNMFNIELIITVSLLLLPYYICLGLI